MPILQITIRGEEVSYPNGCQPWWVNFVTHCRHRQLDEIWDKPVGFKEYRLQERLGPGIALRKMIATELSKYNADMVYEQGENCLNFKSEQDITLFLLKWS